MKAFSIPYSEACVERLHDEGNLGKHVRAIAIRKMPEAHSIQLNAVGTRERDGKEFYVFNFVARDDELAEEIEGAFEALQDKLFEVRDERNKTI